MPDDMSPEDAAEAAERARLAAEAERVMNESRPTPTQAEVDAIKAGKMDHDDKEDPENPEMPPLHEQHARIADARRNPHHGRRRSAGPDDEHATYRTRDMAASAPAERAPAQAAAKPKDDDESKPTEKKA